MKNTSSDTHSSHGSGQPPEHHQHHPFSWRRLKEKKISYFTLPLIFGATLVEIVILSTGWKYQQVACLPPGMGVTFFHIGPLGAVILAVELLKLPLAIWTASRSGWLKWVMVMVGLPLVCVLTFQLVKDMAVYEMGVALKPADRLLEEAQKEEIHILQLEAELDNQGKDEAAVQAAINQKKADRDQKRAELAANRAKGKADYEESLKRNEESRHDAITLTDYQKKELAEVESRQAAIIAQFNSDTEQLTKAIGDLRTRREAELARTAASSADWEARKKVHDAALAKWNAEEARIENAYQQAMLDYNNAKAKYEKDRIAYLVASDLKRQFMKEPVPPGLPPVREVNSIAKPAAMDARPAALVDEFDRQIKAKEDELAAANAKRRERVAQVDADARHLREEFDRRSGTKREEMDAKREALQAAYAAQIKSWDAEEKQIDEVFDAAVAKEQATLKDKRPVDVIRAEADAARKHADSLYEDRVAAINNTQVHRIATTVEIVRGWILGEKPVSVKNSPKERGDLLVDQISMVRIWVYPVLAFIVAYLPTLMVEVGFSTLFEPPPQKRPNYRIGWFGRRLHDLYKRAGRQKILRAERLADQVHATVSARDDALAAVKEELEQLRISREAEAVAADEAAAAAQAEHEAQLQAKEEAWVAKFGGLAESLNRAVAEKDALRDLQKAEIERQVQLRHGAWADRMSQLQQELDAQRAGREADRAAMVQEHHKKMLEVSEEAKTQVIEVRRQMADAELAAVEASAKLAHDLKEAQHARDMAEAQLQQQSAALNIKLTQAKEDAARELEKAMRQEKYRFDRQQQEMEKALRQKDAEFEHKLKQREQEAVLLAESRQAEVRAKLEETARRREAELERQFETALQDEQARFAKEFAQKEELLQAKLKQRDQQVQAQLEAVRHEVRTQAAKDLQVREAELVRAGEARLREAEVRFAQELARKEEVVQLQMQQQAQESAAAAETKLRDAESAHAQALLSAKEAALAKLKQAEREFGLKLDARAAELRAQFDQETRNREAEWERNAEVRVRAVEERLTQEMQQQEELQQMKAKQREQQLLAQAEARLAEAGVQAGQEWRRREAELERAHEAQVREVEARLKQELAQREAAAQAKAKQREQEFASRADARESELRAQFDQELRQREQEWERQAEARLRAAEARLGQEQAQKEEVLQIKLRSREQQLQAQFEGRIAELQAKAEQELRVHEQEWERNAEARQRAAESRLVAELQQKEELFQSKARQQGQQWQAQVETARLEAQAAAEQEARRREAEIERNAEARLREVETRLRQELAQRDEAAQAKLRQREQDLTAQLTSQADARLAGAQTQWEADADKKLRAAVESSRALLQRAEKERDEARQAAANAAREAQDLEKRLTEVSSFLSGWKK